MTNCMATEHHIQVISEIAALSKAHQVNALDAAFDLNIDPMFCSAYAGSTPDSQRMQAQIQCTVAEMVNGNSK